MNRVHIHLMCIECELNPHRSCSHCQNFETELELNCCWHATPTAAQVMISTLALLSQHTKCIETHTKVHPIICLALLLVADNVEREFRRTTQDHLVSGLFRQHLVSSVPA